MRRIEIVQGDGPFVEGRSPVPRGRLVGGGRSRLASPPDASIWMSTALFDAGAALEWDSAHGEEAFYVEQGELSVDGRACPAGTAVVLEAHVAPIVRAAAPSRVLHMGASDAAETPDSASTPSSTNTPDPANARDTTRGRALAPAPNLHVIGPRGIFEAIEPGRESRFFADATCPTCSVWLLMTARTFAYESPIHSHARDELIHVLRGEIQIGSLALGPGDTVFIAVDQVYRFRSGPEGFAFLNYRSAASVMTIRPSGEKIVEAGAATGMVRVAEAMAS